MDKLQCTIEQITFRSEDYCYSVVRCNSSTYCDSFTAVGIMPNVSTSLATKIFKQYGCLAVSIVTENPYRLADNICGVGFKSGLLHMIIQNNHSLFE